MAMSELKKRTTSSEIISACRFCWMCRHVCSVGNETSCESDTPRGKALLLYGKISGMDIQDKEIAESVYNCALCYRCLENCVGAFDVPEIVLNTRCEMAAEGLFPKEAGRIREVLCDEKFSGGRDKQEARKNIEADLGPLADKASVVLFGGYSTFSYAPGAVLGAARLLKAAKIDFAILPGARSSGYELLEMGFLHDATEVAKVTAEMLEKIGDCSKGRPVVVTFDPSDNWALRTFYKKWGIKTAFDAVDFSTYAWGLVESGKVKFREVDLTVTYHDPCHLGRVQRVFAQPRNLLGSVPGLALKEMFFSREQALCCGGHLRFSNPGAADGIARKCVEEIKLTGASAVVTSCPVCCDSFRRVSEDLRVLHLAELLGMAV